MGGRARSKLGEDDPIRRRADAAARTMVEQATGEGTVYVPDEINGAVPLADVAHDVERFGAQVRYADREQLPLPCLIRPGGAPLPINVDSILFPLGSPADRVNALQAMHGVLIRPGLERVELLPPARSREAFLRRLRTFLYRRIGGFRDGPAAMPVPPEGTYPGLFFEVRTRTPGLRVYYHPSYWHDTNTVFGQPSSPVRGFIKPGRYVFGAMGHGSPLRFEPDEYEIPPLTSAQLFL